MSVKTYKLNIVKSDGTNESVSFSIPDTGGTHKLKFTLSNGKEIDAGNITVGLTENYYDLKLTLSNGSIINAGTIITPIKEPKPTFANASWSEISEISESGSASEYFAIGDEKIIELSTGEEITLVILGFDHDDLSDNSGKAGMTIGMKNLLAGKYPMSATLTNEGGWDDSEMRTSRMSMFLSQLPLDLQNIIKQVNKKATIGSQNTTVITSADKLFLLSLAELASKTSLENSAGASIKNNATTYELEGTQYEYFKNTLGDGDLWNASPTLIKKLSNGDGSNSDWWSRSPVLGNNTAFWYISSSGDINFNASKNISCGVSFCFCV